MRKENEFNPDSNYPEYFWPKILTLCIGAFINWVMTSQNADKILDKIFLTQFSDNLTE